MARCTVIIPVHPAHNSEDILGACLRALAGQDLPVTEWDLIVVGDNCDPAPFLEPHRGIRSRSVALPSRAGPIRARNLALSMTDAETVAFLDADSVPCLAWLSSLLAGFTAPDVALCGGRIEDPRHRCFNRDMIGGVSYALPASGLGNAAFRRRVLDEVGWLDENLWIGNADELDLSWRIVIAGYRIAYVEEARIFHKGLPDVRECLSHGIGARLLALKYADVLVPSARVQLTRYLRNCAHSAASGDGLFDVLSHLLVAAGYCTGMIKEVLGLFPEPRKVALPRERPAAADRDALPSVSPPHVVWWSHDGECRVVDFAAKRYYRLADVAGRTWELLHGRHDAAEIASAISSEYAIGLEVAAADVVELLGELDKSGLLAGR